MLPSALKEELAGVINAGLFHNLSCVITLGRPAGEFCTSVGAEASPSTKMWQRLAASRGSEGLG